MTAIASINLTTTQLSELPGNKIAHSSNSTATTKQPFQLRKCLKMSVKQRAGASQHFIKAAGEKLCCSDEEHDFSSDEDESFSSTDDEDLVTSRTVTSFRKCSDQSEVFKPIKPDYLNKNISPRSQNSNEKISFKENCLETLETHEPAFVVMPHKYNEIEERCMLDKLIELDEEEEHKVNKIQTDEDLYIMWRYGESRRTSKGGTDTISNKNSKSGRVTIRKASSSNNQLVKAYNNLFGAWETVYNKKPLQQVKEERKHKFNQTSYNYLYNKNQADLHKNADDRPFAFFHYADIACYIQQYRANHTCENLCPNHLPGCPDPTQLLEIRDLNFPFKFDLASFRPKFTSRGCTRNGKLSGNESQQVRPPICEEQANKQGNGPQSGCLSPVSFRTPYSLKSAPVDNRNYLPESPSRLRYQLKKIWHSYERKNVVVHENGTSTSSDDATPSYQKNALSVPPPTNDEAANPGSYSSLSLGVESVTYESRNAHHEPRDTVKLRLCERNLPKNCLQLKRDNHVISHNMAPDDPKFFNFVSFQNATDVNSHYDVDKTRRMKNLITTEINNIQKSQVITIEQKRKLDKFKQALNAISNTRIDDSILSKTPSGDHIEKHVFAGSVRAYYSRTAANYNLMETVRTQTIKCEDIELGEKLDDKPIIYVSQPHLRHLTKKTKQLETFSMKKKLIGGKIVEKSQRHPADSKQFTRITDLLRIKERQQSGRRGVQGQSKLSPNGAQIRRNKSRHDMNHT